MSLPPVTLLPFPCELRRSLALEAAVSALLAGQQPTDARGVGAAMHLQGPRAEAWWQAVAALEPQLALEGLVSASLLRFTYRPEYKVVLLQEGSTKLEELLPSLSARLFEVLEAGFTARGGRAGVKLSEEVKALAQHELRLKAVLVQLFPDQLQWTDEDSLLAFSTFPPVWRPHALRAALVDQPELSKRPLTDADAVSEATKVLFLVPEALSRHRAAIAFQNDAKGCSAAVEGFPRRGFGLTPSPGALHALKEAIGAEKWGAATPLLKSLLATVEPGPPLPVAPWTSLFPKKAPPRRKAPEPPAFALGGTWAQANPGRPLTGREEQLGVGPWLLEVAGAHALPVLREGTRSSPTSLVGLEEVDDLGLAASWAAAAGRPASSRGPDVHAWVRRFPRLAAAGAVLVLFEDDVAGHRGARVVLDVVERGFPADFQAVRAALSPTQADWVVQARVPPPLGKAPRLPDWVKFSQLPRVLTRDRTQQLSDDARREVVQALKVTPLAEASALLPLQQQLDLASLRDLAAALVVQFISAGAPAKERWAADAMAFFGDDEMAAALGALAEQLTPERYTVAQVLINTLSFLPARAALTALFKLEKNRTASVRKSATAAISQSAALLGYGPEALADQLVPDAAPEGWKPGGKPGAGLSAEEKKAWKAADKAVKDATRRLEQLMVGRRTLPAQHFLETWGLKPLLKPFADLVVWGVFVEGNRVGLFCGAQQLGVRELDPRAEVRPIHLDELSAAERKTVEGWVKPKSQPFPQLARPVYGVESIGELQNLVGRGFSRRKLDAFTALGWSVLRLERIDGVYREGPGWRVELRLNPPIIPFAYGDEDPPQVTDVTVTGATQMPPALLSELQHQLRTLVG